MSITSLFDQDRLRSDDIGDFWEIFNSLLQYTRFSGDGSPTRPAYSVLEAAEAWLTRTSDPGSNGDLSERVANCLKGMSHILWSLRARFELDELKDLPEFGKLESFLRVLGELSTSLGGSGSAFSPWSANKWKTMNNEFLTG